MALWDRLFRKCLKDQASYIPARKYPMNHEAVLKCVRPSNGQGQRDAASSTIRTRCKFEPRTLLCKKRMTARLA
jgi:hypothetical protein